MSNEIERRQSTNLVSGGTASNRLTKRTLRALIAAQEHNLLRLVDVRTESMVAVEKASEIDHLTRSAMTGQAMLRRWADTLAAGDPYIAEELRVFGDMARIGKGEIIADLISTYSRGQR